MVSINKILQIRGLIFDIFVYFKHRYSISFGTSPNSHKILEAVVLKEEELKKAERLEELGYLHVEQIDFFQKIQDFKIKHQIMLTHLTSCPVCGSKTKKTGTIKSKFYT